MRSLFDSMTMFVAFLLGGRLLLTRARHQVVSVLESAMAGMPASAQRVAADGTVPQAMNQRPGLARTADRWAAPLLWAVLLLLPAGAAAVWSVIDPARAVWVAVSVLIVACPCALSQAAPSAMLAAASGLAKRGELLQRLDALGPLTRVQRLYLDKIGTVTDEHPQWAGLTRGQPSALRDGQLLAHALALAAWSQHPLSRALATPLSDRSEQLAALAASLR